MNLFKERKEKISLYQQLRKVFFKPPEKVKQRLCPTCESECDEHELKNHHFICQNCGHYFMVKAYDRIEMVSDSDSFKEIDRKLRTTLGDRFEGYQDKLNKAQKSTQLNEAYVYGLAKIDNHKVVIGVMDAYFMMGSMGSVVGEKITRSIELATKHKVPFIIFTASGGARMQEGILSLVQMSKTTSALKQHSSQGYLSISVLCHPTTGGVSASFAMTTDIVLAEPNATIGFAGKRVIAQTIKQDLPQNFQSSEKNEANGFIDQIVSRKALKTKLSQLLLLHEGN